MKKYIKQNGENPKTPFVKDDIVTYFDYMNGYISQINIMVLDHIEPKSLPGLGDIYYKAMLTFAPNEKPYFIIASGDGTNYRNWFNRDPLRKSTQEEIDLFVQAMVKVLKSCTVLHDKFVDVDINDIINET